MKDVLIIVLLAAVAILIYAAFDGKDTVPGWDSPLQSNIQHDFPIPTRVDCQNPY